MHNKIDITTNRYKMYDMLSYALMNEPDGKLIAALEETNELFKDEIEVDFSFVRDIKLEDLVQEYYDRFFVNSSDLYVPPFEAAIRNKSKDDKKVKYGKLDSKETFHVKACYEMVDFKPRELNMFLPLKDNPFSDHIAFEMAFMTFMVNNEFVSLNEGNEKTANDWKGLQKQFIKEHLSKWIDDYAELTRNKGEGLYSFITNIAALWINLDFEYICEE